MESYIQDINQRVDIVFVVAERLLRGFMNRFKSGKVDNSIDGFLFEDGCEKERVDTISRVECWAITENFCDTFDD